MNVLINIREQLCALSPLFEPKNSSICHPSHNTPSFTSTNLHQGAQLQFLTHTHTGQQSWWMGLLYLPVSERERGKLDGWLSSILCTVCLSVVWLHSISSLKGKQPRSQCPYILLNNYMFTEANRIKWKVVTGRDISVYNIQPNDLPTTSAVVHMAHADELHYRGSSIGTSKEHIYQNYDELLSWYFLFWFKLWFKVGLCSLW